MQQPLKFYTPPDILALADKHHLGAPGFHVGPTSQSTGSKVGSAIYGLIVGGFFAVLGIAFIASGDGVETSFGLFFLLAGLVIGGILLYKASGAEENKYSHVYAYSFEAGLIYNDKDHTTYVARWDQIRAVWRSITDIKRNGVHIRTVHRYTVQCNDGRKFIINDILSAPRMIGDHICDRVTEIQLPLALQAYQQGQSVSFGPLHISQQGISNGRNLLPWTQVKDVNTKNGYVSVKREDGWFRWSTEAASTIPNLFVFLTLVNHILKQHGKK